MKREDLLVGYRRLVHSYAAVCVATNTCCRTVVAWWILKSNTDGIFNQ